MTDKQYFAFIEAAAKAFEDPTVTLADVLKAKKAVENGNIDLAIAIYNKENLTKKGKKNI